MIKSNRGNLEINGTLPVLMAELTMVIRHLHDEILIKGQEMSPEEAKQVINRAVEIALTPKEQCKENAKEAIAALSEVLGGLMKLLNDAVADKKGKGDE